MTNHQADRISFLEHDLKVVQGNLQRADKRIAELEAACRSALILINEIAAYAADAPDDEPLSDVGYYAQAMEAAESLRRVLYGEGKGQ